MYQSLYKELDSIKQFIYHFMWVYFMYVKKKLNKLKIQLYIESWAIMQWYKQDFYYCAVRLILLCLFSAEKPRIQLVM